MDNNAKRWRFITINKNMLVTNFSMYFTFLLFFFQHWNLLIRSTIRFHAQRFAESKQSLEIFKRSSRLWGERSAQRSAVGNIIWLSMHPRISVLTKSSIRMSACLRRRRSKPSVYSVCELVHNIVFESRRVARTYVGVLIGYL